MLDRNTDTDKDETEISPERKTYEQTDNYIETDRETDIHAERERREDEDRETGNERERWRERQIGQKQEPLSGHQKGHSSFSVHLVKEVKR